MSKQGCITDISGIKAGHAQDFDAVTGCTALIFEQIARGGIYYGGPASGTRACDLFREDHLNDQLHGLVLSGGSNYGLDAAGGMMAFLRDQKIGFQIGTAIVPLVPQAIIFDLTIGSGMTYPDHNMGYEAASIGDNTPLEHGSVGAGTGATVGKLYGITRAMKSGVGTASVESPHGPVGAIAVVNAFGNVLDPDSGEFIAGTLNEQRTKIISMEDEISQSELSADQNSNFNTTIAAVAIEADLDKTSLNQLARLADRAINKTHSPAHSDFDGDVIFAISTRQRTFAGDVSELGPFAEEALVKAILSAVKNARTLAGVIDYQKLNSI